MILDECITCAKKYNVTCASKTHLRWMKIVNCTGPYPLSLVTNYYGTALWVQDKYLYNLPLNYLGI